VLNNRYELVSLLGVGGTGAVMSGWDIRERRQVAVKLLNPGLRGEKEAVKRFHREARSAATVGGGSVVAILDYATDANHGPFLVMELLRGCTLQRFLRERNVLSPRDAVALALAVLETLSRVHRQGIVHRDLKPANVWLQPTPQGTIQTKLLDFGACRIIHETTRLTLQGMAVGTPRYMAPEQAQGVRDEDQRCDLHAVGLLLYEALSGTKPYAAITNTGDLMRAVYDGNLEPLAQVAPQVPRPLANAVTRALDPDPQERFPSAHAMAQALSRALDQSARPTDQSYQGHLPAPHRQPGHDTTASDEPTSRLAHTMTTVRRPARRHRGTTGPAGRNRRWLGWI
jgi:serine/threonine-protein kinase